MRKLLLLTILLIAFFSLAPDARAAVLSKAPNNLGLVGYWGFDEGSGTLAGDSSGSGNNGTITGATWTNGKRGKALDFNGSDQHIEISATSALKPATELTISVWFKADGLDAEWGPVVEGGGNLNNGTGYYFGYYPGGTTFVFYVGDGAYDYVATTLTTGQWYHVVGTYSASGSLYLYVNGVQVHTNTHTVSSISYDSSPISIAKLAYCCSSGHHFDGQIDDVRIYSRALSATDVSNLYKAGQVTRKAISERGLVGYWPLNEGTGTVAGDSSGNGNNGTLINSPTWTAGKRAGGLRTSYSTPSYVSVSNFDYGVLRQGSETATWTLSIWAKQTAANSEENILLGRQGCNGGIYTWNGGYAFAIKTDSCWTNAQSIYAYPANMSDWHHLVAVYDNRAMTFYVDGVSSGTATFSATMTAYGTTFGIGSGGYSFYAYNGVLDDARVYNRALSAAEVAALYKQNETTLNSNTNSRLTSGLVGLWSFNGNNLNMASTTAEILDMSGNGNHGDNSGGRSDAGRIGQGWNFDGADDYVAIGDTSALDLSTQGSLSIWARPDRSMPSDDANYYYRNFISKSYGGSTATVVYSFHWHGTNSLSELRMCISTGAAITCQTYNIGALNIGSWYNFAVTWNTAENSLIFYVNGAAVSSLTNTNAAQNSATSLYIGGCTFGCGANQNWDGQLDEARVYNRALSASEIKQLYNMGQ